MYIIREDWPKGSAIFFANYYPVSKKVLMAKARDFNYLNFCNKTLPADDYLIDSNGHVHTSSNIYLAVASLNQILRLNFNNNFKEFKNFFCNYEALACPDFSSGNVLLVSKKDGIVIRLHDCDPAATLYAYEEFYITTARFLKSSQEFDAHKENIWEAVYELRK